MRFYIPFELRLWGTPLCAVPSAVEAVASLAALVGAPFLCYVPVVDISRCPFSRSGKPIIPGVQI